MRASLHRRFTLGLVVLALTAAAMPLVAWAGWRLEDFLTVEFRDPNATSAVWDTGTGEIRLHGGRLRPVGFYAGGARDVVIRGDVLYVASANEGLDIVDVTSPSEPVRVGNYDSPGSVRSLDVAGHYAYLADGLMIDVVDVRDSTRPVHVATYDTPGENRRIVVNGKFAYVAAQGDGAIVLDVSNPAQPTLAATVSDVGYASALHVAGNYLYVIDNMIRGFRVFNIASPRAPSLVVSVPDLGDVSDVRVSGNIAYVSCGKQGIATVDVTTPARPVVASQTSTLSYPHREIAVDGDRLYLTDGWVSGLEVLDISDPARPAVMEGYTAGGDVGGVTVDGEYIYLVEWGKGVRILTMTAWSGPDRVGGVGTADDAFDVALDGNYAFVPQYGDGLQIIDITNPESPLLAGVFDTPGYAVSVAVDGDHAFIADHVLGGFQVINIVDPGAPKFADSFSNGDLCYSVTVDGGYAFVGFLQAGMLTFDVTRRTDIRLLGQFDTPGAVRDIVIDGNIAYVIDNTYGLFAVDISDPANPLAIGDFQTNGRPTGVAVLGDVAYVADGDAGLLVLDVRDPAAPARLGGVALPAPAVSVAVVGDRAFVADHVGGGLQVVDVSNPASPAIAGGYVTGHYAHSVAVAGDYAFLVDGAGMQVFRVFEPGPPLYDDTRNVVQSRWMNWPDDYLTRVRMTTVQSGEIHWQMRTEHMTWTDVAPGGDWLMLDPPADSLFWRATLVRANPLETPRCSELRIEWEKLGEREAPIIWSIGDVPADQGGAVRVVWERSGFDVKDSADTVDYEIYRRIDNSPGMDATASVSQVPPSVAAPPGWELVKSVAGEGRGLYAAVAPTESDSTMRTGLHTTVLMVRAQMQYPHIFFDSEPDSGYSLDNLPPAAPPSITVSRTGGGNRLTWPGARDDDVFGYHVYRSTVPTVEPSSAQLVHSTTGTEWVDPEGGLGLYFYGVTSEDLSGNESGMTTSYRGHGTVEGLVLYPNVPNPFNPATLIEYNLPSGGGHVTLRVYDALGRRVATLVDERQDGGPQGVVWKGVDDTARPVASGVYYYRLSTAGRATTRAMVLVR